MTSWRHECCLLEKQNEALKEEAAVSDGWILQMFPASSCPPAHPQVNPKLRVEHCVMQCVAAASSSKAPEKEETSCVMNAFNSSE